MTTTPNKAKREQAYGVAVLAARYGFHSVEELEVVLARWQQAEGRPPTEARHLIYRAKETARRAIGS